MNHLIEDYDAQIKEDDMTHLEKILKLHDLSRDPIGRPFDTFKRRCETNLEYRAMHHHVFDQNLLSQIASFCSMKIKRQFSSPSDHYILLEK